MMPATITINPAVHALLRRGRIRTRLNGGDRLIVGDTLKILPHAEIEGYSHFFGGTVLPAD